MSTAIAMEPISAKLRHDEKVTFAEVCDSIGTTPSNAIRMFVSAFNKRGGFPFDPSNPYGFSEETLAAMSDAANGTTLYGPYKSIKDMFDALEED